MKAQEVHKLSDAEVGVEIQRLRRHLFDLHSQAVTEKIEDTSQFAKAKKDIARLLTETKRREIERQIQA